MLSEIKKANEREGEVLKTKKRVLLDEQGTETNVWGGWKCWTGGFKKEEDCFQNELAFLLVHSDFPIKHLKKFRFC